MYLKITKNLIPDHLKKNIKFIYSPLVVKKIDGVLMSFYKNLKILDYDFIYEELSKPIENRKIKMIQIEREIAQKSFRQWNAKRDKKEY